MANLELTGVLTVKGETIKKTETFTVREFILEVPGDRFADYYNIQLTNDNCAKLDKVNIGDTIDVKINVRGRKWDKDGTTKAFNSLDAWFVSVVSSTQTTTDTVYTPPTEQIGKADRLPF